MWKPKGKMEALRSALKKIAVPGVPLLLMWGLWKTGILGEHLYFYTASWLTVASIIFGMGVILFGYGKWMKKGILVLLGAVIVLTLIKAIELTINGIIL